MAKASEQMKMIDAELQRIRDEMERLRIEEGVLLRMKAKMSGEALPDKRPRSRSVKPVILDIMHEVGPTGATTAEVDAKVKLVVPTVAKDTVGSILSRLKSEGALVYEGDRYYEKQFAPKPSGSFSGEARTVN